HEPAVPVVGQANQDTRLTLRILSDASVDLNARYRPGDGRAVRRIWGNGVAIGLWHKRKRRQCRNRVVGRGRRQIGGGEISTVGAGCIDQLVAEAGQHSLASARLRRDRRMADGQRGGCSCTHPPEIKRKVHMIPPIQFKPKVHRSWRFRSWGSIVGMPRGRKATLMRVNIWIVLATVLALLVITRYLQHWGETKRICADDPTASVCQR